MCGTAARAGKHVLVEKPIALSMEENRRLRDAVADSGVKSLASFCLRWNPAAQTIKSLVDSGAIGELFYLEMDYWHGLDPSHHAWELHSKRKTGGSAMLLGGCHACTARGRPAAARCSWAGATRPTPCGGLPATRSRR